MADTEGDLPADADPPLLTVAQAAERLGVSERNLRRLLERPEFAAVSRQVPRRTRRGVRLTAMIPPSILADVRATIDGGSLGDAPNDSRQARGDTRQDGGDSRLTADNAPGNGFLPAVVYQRLLEEKDARIGDLRSENERIQGENERLHDALRLAQENLQREQQLRLLAAPPETETPPTDTAAEADKPTETATEKPRRGFWGWFLGRG